MSLHVERVEGTRAWRDFMELPRLVYARDANWVPPLGAEVRRTLDPARNPYFRRARLGIGYVPEDRQIFPDLTVRENIEMGQATGIRADDGWTLAKIYDLFPVLRKYDRKPAGYLSGGEQQMLTIARTLMGNPALVLLDEPTEGLAPVIVIALKEMILRLKAMGTTILLSEQNVKFAVKVSDRVFIIDNGTIRYRNDIAGFMGDEAVQKRYLAV